MKNIDETRHYLIEEINQNELICKKYEKLYIVSIYTEHLFIIISTITWYVTFSDFATLVGSAIRHTSSARGLKICLITAGIKKYDPWIQKRKAW